MRGGLSGKLFDGMGAAFVQVRVQALHHLLAAFDAAVLADVAIAFLGGREGNADREAGAFFLIGEDEALLEVDGRRTFAAADECEADAVEGNYFGEGHLVGVVGTVGAMHDEAPLTARSKVHLQDGGGEAFGTPPLTYLPGVSEGTPDHGAGRSEEA